MPRRKTPPPLRPTAPPPEPKPNASGKSPGLNSSQKPAVTGIRRVAAEQRRAVCEVPSRRMRSFNAEGIQSRTRAFGRGSNPCSAATEFSAYQKSAMSSSRTTTGLGTRPWDSPLSSMRHAWSHGRRRAPGKRARPTYRRGLWRIPTPTFETSNRAQRSTAYGTSVARRGRVADPRESVLGSLRSPGERSLVEQWDRADFQAADHRRG